MPVFKMGVVLGDDDKKFDNRMNEHSKRLATRVDNNQDMLLEDLDTFYKRIGKPQEIINCFLEKQGKKVAKIFNS